MKLEEACGEKFTKTGKLSLNFMAHNFCTHLANCRENIACILIQIITFYYDAYFLEFFPKYLSRGLSGDDAVKKIEQDDK